MRAATYTHYGEPEDVHLVEIEDPTPKKGELILEVRATSLNASDLEFLRGSPAYVRMWGLRRPGSSILGSDVAGVVRTVGPGVSGWAVGDEVFGDVMGTFGGLAELARVPAKAMVRKPAGLSFEVASTLPQAACVAMQSLGGVKTGEKVLIVGAGGGSGTFAIQIAKIRGAEVTGVDNEAKQACMRRVGADHVIDHRQHDVTTGADRYDRIVDFVGSHPLSAHRRILTPRGRYLMVGGSVPRLAAAATVGPLLSWLSPKKSGLLAAVPHGGLDDVVSLVESGALQPVIDRIYSLDETRDALRHLAAARACGKIVVRV